LYQTNKELSPPGQLQHPGRRGKFNRAVTEPEAKDFVHLGTGGFGTRTPGLRRDGGAGGITLPSEGDESEDE
jgi:hypothetical protein